MSLTGEMLEEAERDAYDKAYAAGFRAGLEAAAMSCDSYSRELDGIPPHPIEGYEAVANAADRIRALTPPEPVSAADYGAKGDGVTDDAPAIQAAIDAAGRALTPPKPGKKDAT